ncbi:MAG: DUF5683 domain-containing protein [Muribaculaceae bacterium]
MKNIELKILMLVAAMAAALVLLLPCAAHAQQPTMRPTRTNIANNERRSDQTPLPPRPARNRGDRVPVELSDSTSPAPGTTTLVDLAGDTVPIAEMDSLSEVIAAEVIKAQRDSLRRDSLLRDTYGKVRIFRPDPTRAVWLSALCPGLGQIYNRRYWKLPIVVGGFLGLTYATTWNNSMLKDYTKAYGDAMDSDPNTKSYMDFYPPTTREEDINIDWLKRVLKSKKDFYRRNRDLCIISMVGLYLLCMVDAYVDASLANFDITPDLSMKVKPAVIEPQLGKLPAVGLQCAVSF